MKDFEHWPKDYKQYVKKVFAETQKTKEHMEKNGWKGVCITPNTISLEDWIKGKRPE